MASSENTKTTLDFMDCSQGQYIIREGDEGDCAYIVIEGEVEVTKYKLEDKDVVIAVLGANEIFGEMCLFEEDSRRSASVRVVSDKAKVMVIQRKYFQSQIEGLPEGVRSIVKIIIDRLRRADYRIAVLC